MHLNCNLSPAPRRRPGIWLLAGLLMTGILIEVAARAALLERLNNQQQALEHLQRQINLHRRLAMADHKAVTSPETLTDITRIAAELTRPWEAELDSIQSLIGHEITLDRIRPESANGAVRLQGHATNPGAFLQFLQRLQVDPHWHHVLPVTEEQDSQQPAHPLRFELTAQWGAS